MFESLKNNLTGIFNKLTSKGFLNEEDVNTAMREVRVALLEADVSLPVAKDFVAAVKEKAIGQEITKSVSPGHMVIKIVQDELTEFLGADTAEINLNTTPPAVILMTGLQGSGKTTSSAKLASYLKKKKNKKVLLASLDVERPAAQQQLEILAKQAEVNSLEIVEGQKPIEITKRALNDAKLSGYDVLILDTAGRLHIDDKLMNELIEIEKISKPIETFLVADSLTGQDAVNIANHFNEKLELTGIILTRIDGDQRGGAALSMKHSTGKPIKFTGQGEKLEDFSEFHPQRIASRILDKGDIVSLVERAAEFVEQEEAEKMAKRMSKGKFDLNDLLSQLRNIKKMGGLSSMLGMLPGLGGKMKDLAGNANIDEKVIARQEAIILSMTKQERKHVKLINASRKQRIATGAGVTVNEINKLLKQFQQMEKMMKKVSKMDKKSLMRGGLKNLFG